MREARVRAVKARARDALDSARAWLAGSSAYVAERSLQDFVSSSEHAGDRARRRDRGLDADQVVLGAVVLGGSPAACIAE